MSVLDSFSLKGKVAVVTGGAGRYGRQIVRALAEAGARTCVASRNREKVEAVAEACREAGGDVFALSYDQGEESSILALRDEVLAREGRVDVLVNNSVARPMKSWNDPAEKFAESMKVNATGVFLITRAFGDAMQKAGRGSIVNIASMQGMIGPDTTLYKGLAVNSLIPDYFFHKGGMINFTRFAASYYGASGVRCNSVCPGGLDSEDYHELPAEFIRRYSDRTLLGRMANDTDLMGAVVFLASDASAYITGANIPVDGGYTAK